MRLGSKYTPELAALICDRLSTGRTLKAICREDDDVPVSDASVRQWALDDVDGFAAQYAMARDLGLDAMSDELLDISDDGSNDWMERQNQDGSTFEVPNHEHINRSRLRVDTRKWYLSKLAPKRYGDRLQTDITNSDGSLNPNANDKQIADKLEAIRRAAIGRAMLSAPSVIEHDPNDASDIA